MNYVKDPLYETQQLFPTLELRWEKMLSNDQNPTLFTFKVWHNKDGQKQCSLHVSLRTNCMK